MEKINKMANIKKCKVNTVGSKTKNEIRKPKKRKFCFEYSDTDGIQITEDYNDIFTVDIAALQYCCGIVEIGDICLNDCVVEKEDIENLYPLIKKSVESIVDSHTGDGECVTLVANLIDNAACGLLRRAFVETDLFTLVKTFRNQNSGKQIEMWVSNN